MQAVQLNVADEVKALGDALQALVADVIAKKSIAQDVSDVLPNLVAAAGGYQNLGVDIGLADNEAYLVRAVKLGINGK